MTADSFQPLIDWFQAHPDWILWGVALIAFVESLALAGIVVPGVLLLFLVAALAGSLAIPLEQLLLAGFIGAVLGDGISFYIGYYFKEHLRHRWPFSRYPKALQAGERYFVLHGGKSVILGRFVGPIRPVMPLVAGMLNMPPWRFFAFNLGSALAWSPFYLLPGYLTGNAANAIVPERFYTLLSALVILIFGFALLFRWLSLKLQKGSDWYDALAAKRASSKWVHRVWIALTRHQRGPSEFPLASLFLLCGSLLFFVVWTLLALGGGTLATLDQQILTLSQALRSAAVDPYLVALTMIGDEAFLYCAFTLFIGVMLLQGRPMAAVHLLVAGLTTAVITHALKYGFALPRPELAQAGFSSYAYPSGHSSGATVLFGLAAAFLAQSTPQQRRWLVYLFFAAPILIIALTRVLLGVHWFSDIVGGICLGLAICAATRVCYSRYTVWQNDQRRLRDSWILAGGITLWLLALLIYIYWRFDAALLKYPLAS